MTSAWKLLIEAYRKMDKPLQLKVASLAQWIVESARGTSELATAHLNFGGLKYREEMAFFARPIEYKAHDGEGLYCEFANVEDFIAGYWAFIGRAPYKGWESHAATAEEYIKFIASCGYAEDPQYVQKVIAVMPEAEALLKAEEQPEPVPKPKPTSGVVGVACIVVGHEKRAGGAALNNKAFRNEYEYNSRVAALLKSKAAEVAPNLKVHVIFRDIVGISGAYKKAMGLKPDCVIELHFNAANGTAVGSETLTSSEEIDVRFARVVHAEICKCFGRAKLSRGVKLIERNGRGGYSLYSAPGRANCLVEPFFGDNAGEAAKAVARIEQYAEALLRGIINWLEK